MSPSACNSYHIYPYSLFSYLSSVSLEISSSMERDASSFNFPPGFRFHPSDEELIVHYLQNKVTSRPIPASVIAEIDLYKYNPWELPDKALFGEDEWFFFSPRDRKYPNGARPNRAAASGFWKATGTDKPIFTSGSKSIGVKKALVFYTGRPPKGTKTDWIMNEYRLNEPIIKPSRLKGSMRLDDWVLCRVQQRGNMLKNSSEVRDSHSPEWTRYLPKIETQPTKINCVIDTDDYLYKDCQVLASILSGQTPAPTKTGSSISFQDGSDKGNYSITLPSLESNFNPLKRKDGEEYEEFPPRKMLDNNNVNQNQFQDIFNPNSENTIMDFLELNEIAFTDHMYTNEETVQKRPWFLKGVAN